MEFMERTNYKTCISSSAEENNINTRRGWNQATGIKGVKHTSLFSHILFSITCLGSKESRNYQLKDESLLVVIFQDDESTKSDTDEEFFDCDDDDDGDETVEQEVDEKRPKQVVPQWWDAASCWSGPGVTRLAALAEGPGANFMSH